MGQAAVDSQAPAVVLDTNVVLDWLVFEDPGVQSLADALGAGHLRWLASAAMLEELAIVLRREAFQRWASRLERALTLAHGTATLIDAVAPLAGHPVCSDPDDQKFIDLALLAPARWLVTRDKALLKLARAAAARGVVVCRPDAWTYSPR